MSKTAGTHTWLVLMKTHRALARHAERSIGASQMCGSDFVVLELLLNKGPQRVNDIGRTIGLTSGSITTAVDRLEDRGLVARSFDSADRRTRIVTLTATGRALIEQVFARHAAAMDRAGSALSAAEHATLVALLKKLGKGADAQLTGDDT
jgi:MarR family 2-MHQ and catechol resistance regulon transcriptional repressor